MFTYSQLTIIYALYEYSTCKYLYLAISVVTCVHIHISMNSIARLIIYPLLLLLLLHSTTCTVYTVIPNYNYNPNTTCHHCHNLQHYVLNVTKYFTSNTQLLFLPGSHNVLDPTKLIIQNVYNISLIGRPGNSTARIREIIINNNLLILMINISRLTIKNITFATTSTKGLGLYKWDPLLTIKDCSSVTLDHLVILKLSFRERNIFALVGINIKGNSNFSHVKILDKMQLFYNKAHTDKEHHNLLMSNCEVISSISLKMFQDSYKVTLKIIDTHLQLAAPDATKPINVENSSFIYVEDLGPSEVILINCRFIHNTYAEHLFFFASSSNGSVRFINCRFINNSNFYSMFYIALHNLQLGPRRYVKPALIKIQLSVRLEFKNCYFQADSEYDGQVLQIHGSSRNPATVVIDNTTFSYYISKTINPYQNWFDTDTFDLSFIISSNSALIFQNSVVFRQIATLKSVISLKGNSTIIIFGSVEFSCNVGEDLINFYENNKKYIIMKENSIFNICHNEVSSLFPTKPVVAKYPYPVCLFQYFSNHNASTVPTDKRNFLIRFCDNRCKQVSRSGCYDYMQFTHCLWLPQSLFNTSIPLEVNNKYMQFVDNSSIQNLSQKIEQSSLCVCTSEVHYDCQIFKIGYVYPGQTLTISLLMNQQKLNTSNAVAVKTDVSQQYVTPCIVLDINENLQLINRQCTKLQYTIGFSTESYCELFLKLASDSDEYLNIFSIRQITCPTGFVKIDKRCQCDPVLVQYGITSCNINDQTILRPPNSWISSRTHNNSYTYHTSLHCPFHYCLPHSSHLNFSTPNSQCQFNRSGLLCGHCQQGLSTVFSSSHCQHCSSVYLLLIIPLTVVGVILVLMLFALNLTVTNGTINGFIFYVNIISINTPVFFTELSPTYTFVSLANLDLGIQTCFYNGMDDYAKMWLQLAFPFYLIFIATLIIITSRYSTTIQRLTARRALPVLATLFLLSYTKILRIVSNVLFFYSTITHLRSKHTTLVWSVDANVPLFGVRFTILFIVCLILFLILVPFNVILLFTRTLSRFRFINKFKPLLDAYQGPYKDKFYYWTGLQLLMRAVFFGISSLDRNINIAISILLLSAIIGFHGMMQPFKVKYKNYQEMLLFFNLEGLYVILSYSQGISNTTAVNVMITIGAVHFSFITVYHMITFVYGGVIRDKIQWSVNTFTAWSTRLCRKSHTEQFQLQDSTRDNIPEVAFNYREYREPLVGVDC